MAEQRTALGQEREGKRADLARFAGKYLTFVLADEFYGVDILKVREIIGIQNITRVPETDPCVKGVINLRGQVIAVVDLRLKFGFQAIAHTAETCIIIVETREGATGMIVDHVEEVADLAPGDIESAPRFNNELSDAYIRAMGHSQGRLLILIDTETILAN